MLIDAFLRRSVVIGRNHQRAVCAGLFRLAGEANRFVGGVRSGPRDHWDSLVYSVYDGANDLIMLLVTQGRRFAGGAARDNSMRPVLQVKVDQTFETLPVDRTIFERCDQGNDRAGKHRDFSYSISITP